MNQSRLNELSVIGSLLISPEVLPMVEQSGLSPESFYEYDCRHVYQTILNMRDDGKDYSDVALIGAEAAKSGQDYVAFLSEAMQTVPSAANVLDYCALVLDESKRRSLNFLLHEAAFDSEVGDWHRVAEQVSTGIQDIGNSVESGLMDCKSLTGSFRKYYALTKEDPSKAYCPTGIEDLDLQLGGGMFRSEMYVLGARPGMGKTTFAINLAESVVRMNKAVLFVSLEMTADQIMAKRIAIESGLSYNAILTGRIPSYDEDKLEDAIKRIEPRKFFLTTKSGLTVAEIGRLARQVKDLALIIIDYLGLISPGEELMNKTRYEQMTCISAAVKAMAKNLNVPVLALSQLNRENASRQDKRPSMSDLRDSGAIEQDAGGIILLHRNSYYEPGTASEEDIELNVAKNRHSSPGVVTMTWTGQTGRTTQKQSERFQPVPDTILNAEELPF